MVITPNSTMPDEWDSSKTYAYGDEVVYNRVIYKSLQTPNYNKNPFTESEYWLAIDIYKKDATVMPHGQYAGDDSFWDRDEIRIDESGNVYINNETTGINVRGPRGDGYVRWEDLTAAQRESLKGEQGDKGDKGDQGIQGIQGPMGEVVLTPEQIAVLKGDTGKSNYELWLEAGHQGTVNDYLAWLIDTAIDIDNHLSQYSSNPVENRAISAAFELYKTQVNELLHQYEARLQNLEDRLKYVYNNETRYFKFGITTEGEYGYYYKEGSGEHIIPFNESDSVVLNSLLTQELQGVAAQQFASNNSALTYATIASNDPRTGVSLEGSISNSTGEDDIVLQQANVESMRLTDYINQEINYTEIFRDGVGFLEDESSLTYGFDGMSLTNGHLRTTGSGTVRGIYFNPPVGVRYSQIYIKVAPLTQGETVEYQRGCMSAPYENLAPVRAFINDPSRQSDSSITYYENGALDTEETVFITVGRSVQDVNYQTVGEDTGAYFCGTNGVDFKIIQIYCF